jgi:hypothetical protein
VVASALIVAAIIAAQPTIGFVPKGDDSKVDPDRSAI